MCFFSIGLRGIGVGFLIGETRFFSVGFLTGGDELEVIDSELDVDGDELEVVDSELDVDGDEVEVDGVEMVGVEVDVVDSSM